MKHAAITVNGSGVDAKGDGIVVVLPPDVDRGAIERALGACAYSSVVDGTGTQTLVFHRAHLKAAA